MTSPPSESLSLAPSSSDPCIDIYLFNCGHGDTILIRLPDGRWGLVDCYLPDAGGVRDRFFKFVQDNSIRTLEFIFQTHPHSDHFHGMEAVVEYFVDSGQRIGAYYDSGLTARQASYLLYRSPAKDEYQKLQRRLSEWAETGKLITWAPLTAGHFSIGTRKGMERITFLPIAPDPTDLRQITIKDLQRLAVKATACPAANALSLVIALSVVDNEKTFNFLLGADAEIAGLSKALAYWKRWCDSEVRYEAFNALKVPHHGSKHSHHSPVCATRATSGRTVAAVTAGVREALPDRAVLAEYLDAGWEVVATTTRGRHRETAQLPMQLANRSGTQAGPQSHLIQLTWNPTTGLSISPPEASIRSEDLPNYETAKT